MRTSREHDPLSAGANQQRVRGALATCLLAMLIAGSVSGVTGCGKKADESPPSTSEMESASGTTQTINLNMDAQDTCVTFVPKTTSIHVGDRVNFTTNSDNTITVHVPAGLFSAGDTSITVSRGANSESPTAQLLGSYPLTSTPHDCESTTGGGGPIIIVDAGGTP